ncbi:acyltransferase [Acinetobacter sp. ANC 3781]
MKKILLRFMQIYWRWKFSKKAIIGKNVVFGRFSDIKLSAGSKKEDIVIGDNSRIFGVLQGVGGKIIIEKDVHIGPFSTIGAKKLVHIKKLAMISTKVDIIDNNNHPVHPEDRLFMNINGGKPELKTWKYSDSNSIIIGENTWIGKNSLILKGVEVESNSIIAANSVVTKNVPENCIVGGNPAKIVKTDIYSVNKYFNE